MPIGRPKPLNLISEENGKLAIEVRNVKSAQAITKRVRSCDLCLGIE
jgi:hypothetical protein